MTEFNLSHTKHKFQLSVDMLFRDTIHQTHANPCKICHLQRLIHGTSASNSDLRSHSMLPGNFGAFHAKSAHGKMKNAGFRIKQRMITGKCISSRIHSNAVNQCGVIVKTVSVVNLSKGEAGKTRILIHMFRSKISSSGKTVGDTMKLERKAVE